MDGQVKLAEGIWFPDDEEHLVDMVKRGITKIDGRGTYQYHKLEASLQYVKKWRCALDIGMHVGLWSMHLAKKFKTVIGFEPVAEHIECLHMNMAGLKNYEVHNCALGNRNGVAGIRPFPKSTGSTQVTDDGNGVRMCKLDDFEFEAVDFIKIDVEAYEYFVVAGGEQTIKAHKPVIILEQKGSGNGKLNYGKDQYAAKELLESWGAKQRYENRGDFCMSW